MINPASHIRLVAEELERPHLVDLVGEVMAELDSPAGWYSTGLPTLDRLMDGGVRGGDLFVIAARPRVGKSALALQIAIHAAERSVPVAIWSLEMRPRGWVRRALSSLTGISPGKLRTGTVDDEERDELARAAEAFSLLPIRWPSVRTTTPDVLAAEAERYVDECKILIVDYLSLLQSDQGSYSREQEVAAHCRNLKAIANRHNVAVITLAQLNRDADGKVPHLRDLRESGEIEASADEVLFLHRKSNEETNLLENDGLAILAKNRDGACGVFPICYDWRYYRFDEATQPTAHVRQVPASPNSKAGSGRYHNPEWTMG